jgi:hypothetical protein
MTEQQPPHSSEENRILHFSPLTTTLSSPSAASTLLAPPPSYAARSVPQDLGRLTIRNIDEIMGMEHDETDFLLGNGYLTRGERTAICGMGGVGKSRLVMQLAMCCRTGRDFIGWETRATDTRWLFLQTENSTRRLQSELHRMLSAFTPEDQDIIKAGLFLHTLEGDHDSYLALGDLDNRHRLAAAIEEQQPDIVVFDPLRDFAADDLNTDKGMSETLMLLQRLVAAGDPTRVPLIIHHAGTGRAGIQKVMGFDRSSFSRNSKVLHGWTRAVINVAPIRPDDNAVLVVASGKCNNATEFTPFCIRLNPDTMTYTMAEDIDLEEWQDRVSGEGGKGKDHEPEALLELVTPLERVPKIELQERARKEGISRRDFQDLLEDLLEHGELYVHEEKRFGKRPLLLVSRVKPDQEDDSEE